MKKVFISYKREDRPRVTNLAENLEEVGLQVWFDKSIRVGDHWWDTILEQIEQCDVFIFAISQLALRSVPCQREREYAAALGKPFLLIQVGELIAIPHEYAAIQFGNFTKDDLPVVTRLIGAINRAPATLPPLDPVPRPAAPIAPLDEIAATIDVEANLEFKDQLAILYRLKAAVDDPSAKTQALELIAALLRKTLFVPIQTDCRTILDTNTPLPILRVHPSPVLPLLGAFFVGAMVLGISAMVLAVASQTKATPTAILPMTNTALPITTTAIAVIPTLTSIPASPTKLPSATVMIPTASRTPLTATATETYTVTVTTPPPTVTESPTLNIEQIAASQEAAEQVTAAFYETSTATLWTKTPTSTFTPTLTRTLTPDLNASAYALRTQRVVTATALFHANQTATATRWTATPTRTYTPSATFTSSMTQTPTLIPAGTTLTPTVYARMTIKGISLVYVPPGCFLMGSNQKGDEQPAHEVCLTKGYYIGELEVTNAQFKAYDQTTGKNRADVSDSCKSASNDDSQPVVCVSWEDANAYAQWLGCLLPTEAQWEYAARSPASMIYPWGATFDKTKANTSETGFGKTSAAGKYPDSKSWVGAQDMAGNVWEWVGDWYDESYYTNRPKPDNDPTGPTTGSSRTLRGGGWPYDSARARGASRGYSIPSGRSRDFGFRVVCIGPAP